MIVATARDGQRAALQVTAGHAGGHRITLAR
jgi:hypothetical protein